MFELHTERLRLIPLNAKYLKLLIEHEKELANELSLSKLERIFDAELKQALNYRRSKVLEDEENYIWYTNWLIVLKEQNCAIGGIMLKGMPNDRQEVVIGYYTFPSFQGRGYMTETIITMKNWLHSQPNVEYIIADTEKDNIASHRVLEKAGATLYKETESLYFWKLL
ncbi:GNAT family N-acetyltransferase [Lysinibacillus sp. ZYM-1]|uniref:GNAT family N-acetyltransferase n=1 Tax=Lysinibacillus sp. ZYM-1 TaxID=1681184 RepID=UPI0006CE6169|nr:GNAT family N-acetyltransferase [Lysinibacillus sp. ZYM-1]KPN96448.1 alanine acetyltransferase [Lysinibacillus sp. ZYM-1]